MTVEEFLGFTDTRPDEEKWELIDGEPVLNASASRLHQRIVLNLSYLLARLEREQEQSWEALPGLGVRVSGSSLPQPDFLIRARGPTSGDSAGRVCDDIIVAFEVLSPSTADRDLRWKRGAYTGMPSLSHYVVVAKDAIDVAVYDRGASFAERRLTNARQTLDFPALGITLPLTEIYYGTGLGVS